MTELSAGESARGRDVVRVVGDVSEPDYPGADPAHNLGTVARYLNALHEFVDAIQLAFEIKQAMDVDPLRGAQDIMGARHYGLYESVHVCRISMNSPLVVDLFLGGVSSAGAISAMVYLFKNPDKLGQWWPKVEYSWYSMRVEAEKAKQSYEILLKYRTEMQELESGSDTSETPI